MYPDDETPLSEEERELAQRGAELIASAVADTQAPQSLREAIEKHNRLYYVEDRPQITDAQYDELFRELQELESLHPELQSADSPTQRVGGKPIDEFRSVRRREVADAAHLSNRVGRFFVRSCGVCDDRIDETEALRFQGVDRSDVLDVDPGAHMAHAA